MNDTKNSVFMKESVGGNSILSLSRIITRKSKMYFLAFVLFAIINGAGLVAFGPLLSNTMNSISDPNSSSSDVSQSALYLVYCAIALMFVAFFMVFFSGMASSMVSQELRAVLVENAMKLDAGFFDTGAAPGEVIHTLISETKQVEVFVSSSCAQLLSGISKTVAAIIVCFIYSWNVTLVTISLMPVMLVVTILVNIMGKKYEKISSSRTQGVLNKASDVFSNIRTVTSFHAWKQSYDEIVSAINACQMSEVYLIIAASGQGVVMAANLGTVTLGLWYSALAINEGRNSQFEVLSVISTLSLLVEGLLYVIIALPSLRVVSSAVRQIMTLVDAEPYVRDRFTLEDQNGVCEDELKGSLEFANVDFAYPVQPECQVLSKVSFLVEPGTSVALVGESGSGKSTIVSLLFRFYDPLNGEIAINGQNIACIPLKHLRSFLGLVSQEPVLFAKSIRENIMYGSLYASENDMINAAKAASVHDFIMSLPDGYDTQVGEKGAQMSGGQKQRIAIARAVIRRPAIFVFDEATSALDTKSEKSIQAAINMITEDATSLTIAHRLSTIKDKDNIIAMRNGEVVEKGNHEALMELRGYYFNLVKSQGSSVTDSVEEGSETVASSESSRIMDRFLQKRHSNVKQTGTVSYISSQMSNISSILRESASTVSRAVTTSKHLYDGTARSKTQQELTPRELLILRYAGILSSLCIGSSLPIGGYFASRFFNLYYSDPVPIDQINKWSWGLAGLAFFMGIMACCQEYCWMKFSHKLLNILRLDLVAALLRQEMAWFDREDNNLGALMSMIGSHASQASQAVKDSWYYGGIAIGSLLSAFIIAFTEQWIVTFIMMASLVLMFLIVGIASWSTQASQDFKGQSELASDANLTESIFQYRIVSSFNLQDVRLEEFQSLQSKSAKHLRFLAVGGGAMQGLSIFVGLSVYALVFWYGGKLVDQGDITFEQLIGAIFPIFLGLVGLINAQLQLPAISQGRAYLLSATQLKERKPEIDNTSSSGRKMFACEMGIDFQKVNFAYPSRPSHSVFPSLTLHVPAFNSMAIVGGSGSGKSSIIGLLLRLYDPDRGSISIDGIDIRNLSLESLRRCIGLVGQEPVLFSGTIMDNIRYGNPEATDEACEVAARECFAEQFILSMADGYNTYIGSKGVSLSGGQKQRIAIARAIVKNPDIFLFDEATSALDTESEREVQKTLDKVAQCKTTIIVAHRLNTVRNVDLVTVLDLGRIVEQGSFTDLEKKGGTFTSMLRMQQCSSRNL